MCVINYGYTKPKHVAGNPLTKRSPEWVAHYSDVMMSAMASQITGISTVYSTFVHAQIKENIKALRHWLFEGNSPHKGPVTRKMFPLDYVIMSFEIASKHSFGNTTHHSRGQLPHGTRPTSRFLLPMCGEVRSAISKCISKKKYMYMLANHRDVGHGDAYISYLR